ncbi:hypothetical protein HELRODRAFT_91513 [Helobdella robusta]|uniref:RNA 3'-terminal phosphate cyclase n=1 Tax=Helobdella robusta TaxID=6412 RepID=T1G848_HELRO|nr:hypothetical protein HELRODRAFT_91513 [Helobdella robusta]ESO11323.1 hypothetical protein HELRODRAFT_91513 [Helobdella robusta]
MLPAESLSPILIKYLIIEQGGQLLRNSTSLSCIMNKPVTVENIRAKRDKPGLRAQHLCGLTLLKEISNGQLIGGWISSTKVSFIPRTIEGGEHVVNTQTAGSVCLLIQSALPCLLLANKSSRLVLKGGTNASMAPPFEYFVDVLRPMLRKMGINFECQLVRRGFYPRGGGEVVLTCNPIKKIQPIILQEKGSIFDISGLAYVAGSLPDKIAVEMKALAEFDLKLKYPHIKVKVEFLHDKQCNGNGSGIILVARTMDNITFGASALGEKDKPAELVAKEAVNELLEVLQSKSCVDKYMQDQLIIFMALADGRSVMRTSEPTLHTRTAMDVIERMTNAKFTVDQISEKEWIITCDGISYTNNSI